jgi:hypothetical protein
MVDYRQKPWSNIIKTMVKNRQKPWSQRCDPTQIRRRLVSYEVLAPLRICGIAWELHCLNENSVAHHQPEV